MADGAATGDGTDWADWIHVFLGTAGLALVSLSVVLFTGLLGLPGGTAAALLIHFTNVGMVLLAAAVAVHAWRRPVERPAWLDEDRREAKAKHDLVMQAVRAALVVLTGVAVAVQAGALLQAVAADPVPPGAVELFRSTYLFVLAGLGAALVVAPVVRSWDQGARRAGATAAVPIGVAGLAALASSAIQRGLVAPIEPAHSIFATNVGFLVAGAYAIWYTRFPSPFAAFVEQLRTLPEMQRSLRKRTILVTLMVGGLAAFGLGGALYAASGLGVVDLGSRLNLAAGVAAVVLTTAILTVFAFLVTGRLSSSPERSLEEEDLHREKRMSAAELRLWVTITGSASTAAVLVAAAVLTVLGHTPWPAHLANDLVVFAIMAAIGPYGALSYVERRRTEAIEDRFPELLRDLTEAQRAGMTLPEAVRSTAKGNYGPLTDELRKMSAEISWGVSFNKSLQKFADRIDTPLINRSVALILQASRAGGDVEEILTAASRDAREIRMIHQERKMGMSIYVMIVYIAFFVFLTVATIMSATFVPAMAEAGSAAAGQEVGNVQLTDLDPSAFHVLFFHAAVVQALGGGLVAGIMGEGYPQAGLKHALVLLAVAYVVFRLLIGF